jgi:hypothetical protein
MLRDADGHSGERRISSERWQRISRIVDLALELDPAERVGCIEQQCADDAGLRTDVEQFLAACEVVERSGDFLNAPAHRHASPLVDAIEEQLVAARAALPRMLAAALAGRYEIGDELGSGGMATVFRARDVQANGDVAVKVLHAGLSQTIGSERFLREVRITSSLRHPNILPVLDAGVAGELLYYVMPCVEGKTLRELMRREQQLPLDTVLAIAQNVAAALDESHARGIVHRDVKPQNILLDGDRAFVADFGIARAIEAAGTDRLTESGALLGTPAYMSPEQAAGETTIDRRSDVYSLACVVYEMLVGEPPFTGVSTKAVLAKQLLAPPPDVRVVRPSLSSGVNDVVARALAKQAADRYDSAGAFVRAFEKAAAIPDRERRAHRRALAVAAGVLALAGAAAAVVRVSGRDALTTAVALDTTTVALLPLERDDASATRTVDDDLLHESLARWSGITLVDRFQVTDAIRQRGAVRSENDASGIARALGAGRLVRGSLSSRNGVSRVYLALFDARAGKAVYHSSGEVPADLTAAKEVYARLADSLLLRGAGGAGGSLGRSSSRSLPAAQAIGRARAALDDWELAAADSALEAALAFDIRDPWTNLWAAQVRAWRGLPATSWSTAASRAVGGAASLSVRERALAHALAALAGGEFAAACGYYDTLRRENERDFAAWYGLGQCRRMDKIVVRDSGSPSGWRFRSSYDSALTAYATAFEILPTSLHGYEPGSFERLRGLLLLSTALVSGLSAEDSSRFYARPGFVNNRVVLVPYPWQKVSSGDPSTFPPGFLQAMAAQRNLFGHIAASWSAAFPKSSAAKRAVALSLELLRDTRAIDTLRFARALTTDSVQLADLAAAQVLLLVKFGVADRPAFLEQATALADSLLVSPLLASRLDPALAATLATLRGRCALAESFSRRAPSASEVLQRLTPQQTARAQGLLALSALGCQSAPGELIDAQNAIERDLVSLPRAERNRYVNLLFFRPALLAPSMDSAAIERLSSTNTNELLHAARAYARHDSRAARAALTTFSSAWSEASGPVTPDIAFPEARLFALLGDTLSAITWLDRTLAQVSGYEPEVLGDQATLASLIRSMLLRGQLAARRADELTARRWGSAVYALWSNADPELRRSIEPLQRFARAR